MNLKDTIKALAQQVRECRVDRSIPVLVGKGWAVCVEGYPACAAMVEGGWNFSGTWNRRVSYWDKEKAEQAMKVFRQSHPQLSLRIAHRNTLRDETEKNAIQTIRHILKVRHNPIIKAAFSK